MKFIKSSGKKRIINELEQRFGITSLPYLLIKTGKEKIRGFSGSLSKDEILQLVKLANIEIIGIYLMKEELGMDLRLSFDATQILQSQITKNIIEIDEKQFADWIRGRDLDIEIQEGVYIIKLKNDFIGCGVSNSKKIFNYVPKERRIRN